MIARTTNKILPVNFKNKGKQMLEKLNGFKTFIGIVVSVLPTLLPLVGISFGADDAELINGTVDAVITAIGGLIATYGRVVAKINHAKE